MNVNQLSQAIRIMDGNSILMPYELVDGLIYGAFLFADQRSAAIRIITNSPNQGAGALAEALIDGLEK